MKELELLNAPWTVEPVSPWELAIVDGKDNEIFMTPIVDALSTLTERQWKQAYLVSAAPELLAILIELLDDIEDEAVSTVVNDTIHRANQIINKALGV